MANSKALVKNSSHMVVNCFQISNFVLWQTATINELRRAIRCELLSN